MARGFIAEMQHQARVMEREQAKTQREAERRRRAAARAAEQERKAAERAEKQAAQAQAAEKRRLEKQAKEAHIAAMEADVERLNLELELSCEEIDSLLAATLDVDDYVDLEALKVVVEHPPFDRADLEAALPAPEAVSSPTKPTLVRPPVPTGLGALFGKRRHAKAVHTAEAEHRLAVAKWDKESARVASVNESARKKHAKAEAQRIVDLERERARYDAECSKRETDAEKHNQYIDALIANLGYGAVDAVQEYVSIVLSNSVYPECFPIEHDFDFDPETAELRLRIIVPSPDSLPDTKLHKYVKSSDEITRTTLSQKAQKDRYSGAVFEVALRSLHEVFEADRRGIIKTISLEVGTSTIDPATGRNNFFLFVAAGAERQAFLELNLSNVVPTATLAHLGASVSKNPFGLVAADASGIRRS